MTDTIYADLLRGNILELDKRAKAVSQASWVSLECLPSGWDLWVKVGTNVRTFEGSEPSPLIEKASAFIAAVELLERVA